jgi:hypothetical protein
VFIRTDSSVSGASLFWCCSAIRSISEITVNFIDIEPTYMIFLKYVYASSHREQADLAIIVNARFPDRPAEVRSRAIAPADLDAVARLLKEGFGLRRSLAFWQRVVDRLESHPSPNGLPKYGYVLESGGRLVGAILLIFSTPGTGGDPGAIRCNISSWYVEPAFRGYASLLAAQALRHKNVTYLNISPAPNTKPIVEAQGYTKYGDGLFIAAPALQRRAADTAATLVGADRQPAAPYQAFEHTLLADHAGYGCMSFWCVAAERAYPFVFRRRLVKGVLPCAQLIYCRDIADIARFAGLIGRHLLAHCCPLAVIDANSRVPGLLGTYIDGLMPKYFKGPQRPRLGDLAYTEAALFGM